jgi:hypothetical protein
MKTDLAIGSGWKMDQRPNDGRSALNDPVALYCHCAAVATDEFGYVL